MQIKHRVYYNETDQMGRVYHANFLIWMEKARTETFRERGISYKEIENTGVMLPVSEISIKYFNPVSYDDIVLINTIVEEFTRIKMCFYYEFLSEEGIKFAQGRSVNVFTDKSGKIKRLDKEIFDKIKGE